MLKELFGLKWRNLQFVIVHRGCFLDGLKKSAKKSFCNFYLKEVFVWGKVRIFHFCSQRLLVFDWVVEENIWFKMDWLGGHFMIRFGKITNVVAKVFVKSLVKLLHSFRENFLFWIFFLFALFSAWGYYCKLYCYDI